MNCRENPSGRSTPDQRPAIPLLSRSGKTAEGPLQDGDNFRDPRNACFAFGRGLGSSALYTRFRPNPQAARFAGDEIRGAIIPMTQGIHYIYYPLDS
jgi:hypothetical protein